MAACVGIPRSEQGGAAAGGGAFVSSPRERTPLLSLFCLAILLLLPAVPFAAGLEPGGEVGIDADRLHFDEERRLYVAEGNVEFRSGEMQLTCDAAEYSDLTGAFAAWGHVVFRDPDGTVVCERVEGNARTGLGTFYKAEMDNAKGGYLLKGDRVDKVGEETYRAGRGSLSECGTHPPLWEIRGRNLWVTKGAYVTARSMTLRVAGVPLLYSPYFFFPIKTERQSGFLPLQFGSGGRNGSSVELDYFWALDTDRDATFSYEYLEDNGNRFGLEYRYALTQGIQGSLFGRYIHDRNADREDTRIGMNEDRWEIGVTHFHNLEDRLYGGAFVDALSDGLYLSDFARSSEARVQNNGQSDLSLVDRRPSGNLSLDFRYYQEMGTRRETTTLQSLPELRLDLVPRRAGTSNWFLGLDAGFSNFYRQEEYTSTFASEISSDPQVLTPATPLQAANLQKLVEAGFDPDTALRYQGIKGRRLDLFPRLELPLDPLPYLIFTPRLGYRETLYNRGALDEDFTERGVLHAGFDLTARLHRDFFPASSGMLRHVVEPEISYDYRPEQDQEGVPVYDGIDRIDPEDAFHLKLINRLIWVRQGPEIPDPEAGDDRRELAVLKLDGLYDRRLAEQRFRSLTAELDLNLTDALYIEVNSGFDFREHDLDRLNLDLAYRIPETLSFQVGRRYSRRIPVDPNRPLGGGRSRVIGGAGVLDGLENRGISFWTSSLNWEPTKHFSMNLSGYFNARDNTGDDQSFGMRYERECWGAMVTVSRYDDTHFNDRTQTLEIDKVNEIYFFFTIKSFHLRLFSKEPK